MTTLLQHSVVGQFSSGHYMRQQSQYLFHHKSQHQKAFSLLEVMVAMAISVVIYVGAYGLLNQTLSINESVSKKRESLESVQRALHFIQQDFEQIVPRSIRVGSENSDIIETDGLGGKIVFTRTGWRNPIERSRSSLQRVAYFVEEEALVREHWNVLDREPGVESKQNKLLMGVSEIKYRFLDPKLLTWSSSWDKERDEPLILPAAIEMTLVTEAYGELIRVFRVVDNEQGELSGS